MARIKREGRNAAAGREARSAAPPAPEFSRPVRLSQIDGEVLTCSIEADAAERAALAERFGLLSLDRLTATVDLHPEDACGLVRVAGRFAADLAQTCVVTLDPAPAHIEDAFTLLFSTDTAPDAPSADEAEVAFDAEDPPEPVVGGAIDIGEAVAQQLALALDPYPRRPDASIEALEAGRPDAPPAGRGPFAELARLQRRG